ncbi:hypothetical protein ACFQ38_02495 [Sporosarcina contaminans]|uniref:Uncharacterized protein n=1 Tax=Sporosarcina contaminans TaxID=633403 RepID=A0ABW3TUR5_9BACL
MLVDINLLPEKEKERSVLFVVAVILLCVAILMASSFFLLTYQVQKNTDKLNMQLQTIQKEQQDLKERMHLSNSVNDISALSDTVGWAESYRFFTLPLLRETIALLPERGFFVSFTFQAPHQAEVIVQFDNYSEAAYYASRLKKSSLIEKTELQSVTAVQLEEDVQMSSTILPRYEAVYLIDFKDDRKIEQTEAAVVEEDSDE